jgi:hypothetical protein
MTILTKGGAVEKEKEDEKIKAIKAAAVTVGVVDPTETDGEDIPSHPSRQSSLAWGDVPVDWYLAWRRRRLLTTLCGALLILWLLLAAVVGGILLYRYLHRPQRFYGWCGTNYMDHPDYENPRAERLGSLIPLNERVEVDPNAEVEKIDVPRFGLRRPAVFVHDFKKNLTAIVDPTGMQCFIKPLDRKNIAPPKSFVDLINKMENGYYEQNTKVIRERYRVRLPPLDTRDVAELGSWMIREQCVTKKTFLLEKRYSAFEIREKRDTEQAPFEFDVFSPMENGKSLVIKTTIEGTPLEG